MKRFIKILTFSIFLFSIAFSCGKESNDDIDKAQVKSLNPNGDSELAILMRQMYEEAEQIRSQIAKGEDISLRLEHNEILTARATEPEKVNTDQYEAFAQVHIENIELLSNNNPSKQLVLYESMVNNCLNCHQELCPGPIVRIKKLKLSEKEI